MNTVRLVARTVRGLEELVARQIREQKIGVIDWVGHRELHLSVPDPLVALKGLSTVDDVLLLVSVIDHMGHTKADLNHLVAGLTAADIQRVFNLRQQLTGITNYSGIDVSASFVGRRTFSRFDIEDTVGAYLARVLSLPYYSRRNDARPPADTCSWRITLDGSRATFALRVNDKPSHRRAYKQATVPGTLHPPVAAAMASLADIHPESTVLDPCCGAGTLLIEGFHACPQAQFIGMDHNPAALVAAADNGVGLPVNWTQADAGNLPLSTNSVDRVLVNPPWDRQVPAQGVLARHPQRLIAEIRRVLRPDSTLVALVHDEERHLSSITAHGFAIIATYVIRVAGAPATIIVAQ